MGKKYEEKYKQVAEIASKLTIEEARFRDIQVIMIFMICKYTMILYTSSLFIILSFVNLSLFAAISYLHISHSLSTFVSFFWFPYVVLN